MQAHKYKLMEVDKYMKIQIHGSVQHNLKILFKHKHKVSAKYSGNENKTAAKKTENTEKKIKLCDKRHSTIGKGEK